MTPHHRRARNLDRPRYVPVTDEQLDALRAVARAATQVAALDAAPYIANTTLHAGAQALDALPHLLDDLALADSHAERAADAGGHLNVTVDQTPVAVTGSIDLTRPQVARHAW